MFRKIPMAAGIICLVIGVAALLWFRSVSRLFMFLSPDGQIEPLMLLSLRLCLVSLGPVGLVLVFYRHLVRLLSVLNNVVNRSGSEGFLAVVLSAGLVLRLAVVLLMPFEQWADFKSYDNLAVQWVEKGGYYNGEHPTAYWPPGYPYLLSRIYLIFGHEPRLAAYLNLLLGLSIVLLAYMVARKIWGEQVGRWTAVLMTLFPSQVLFSRLLASEVLFTPLFLTSVLLFLNFDRKRSGSWYVMFLGGLFLGMATLTRAIAKLILWLIIPYWLWESRRFGRTVLFGLMAIIGFAAVTVPWIIRNHYAVGATSINTNSGINLFIGNQPGSGMGYNASLADQFDVNDASREAYIDSVTWTRAWDYIRNEPLAFLKRGVIKVAFFYAVDMDAVQPGMIEAAGSSEINYAVILAFVAESYYLLVLLAAAAGIWIYMRRGYRLSQPGGYLLIGLITYWTAVHFVFYGMGRYHFPIVPMFCAFAALTVKTIVENHRRIS